MAVECSVVSNYVCFMSISWWFDQSQSVHRVSEKNSQNCFCHNFVKFLQNLIMFGKRMAETMKLWKVYSLFTLPNLYECTTMWNMDVPNCCVSYLHSKCCNDLIKHKIHLSVNYLPLSYVCITTRSQIIIIYVQSGPRIQRQWLRCNATGW